MPLEVVERLTRLADASPLALLAALALLALWRQTRRLESAQAQLIELALVATTGRRDATPNVGELAQALTQTDAVQVEAAAAEQRRCPGTRIGSLLVRAGALARPELEKVLQVQQRLRAGKRIKYSQTKALAEHAARKITQE